jgi:hypothetical protein
MEMEMFQVKTCLGLETYVWYKGALARPEDLAQVRAHEKQDSLYHAFVRMLNDALAMTRRGRLVPSR